MLEWLAPSFVYTLVKDAWGKFRSARRSLTPEQIIALRQKWKPQFEELVWKRHQKRLRSDVIIRDMKRVDQYPELKDTKGISSWFRVSLVDTYHRGLLVALGFGWGTLTRDGEGWRFTNYKAGENGDLKVLMLGSIPYENIESVDWDGDEYYNYPHIYCFFDRKKQPYEKIAFYTETRPEDMQPFYTELAPYDEVRKRSRKRGLQDFI
jgi:hypothetical protein